MSWGTLFRENRWQKLFSIGMAVMIWLTVPSTQGLRIARDSNSEIRVFPAVPITVLAKASSLGRYQVNPASVRVELRGDSGVLEQLAASELEAYVNLVDLRATPQLAFIHVNPPPGTHLISVDPIKVLVDRLPNDPAP
ncbi:MAG: hypothetical protein J0L84_04600 [Verrucomicrobia bacterium]|nr:hypothetical protein [Verrucomicrobiota bacterium]